MAEEVRAGEGRAGPAGEAERTGAPGARPPYTRVAVAAVGIVLSLWLWVGESWRFDVTPKDLVEGSPGWRWKGGWAGRYVRMFVRVAGSESDLPPRTDGEARTIIFPVRRTDGQLWVRQLTDDTSYWRSGVTGRAVSAEVGRRCALVVDTTRGRWTAASAVALLVFVWGAGIVASSIWVWRKRCEA